MIQFTEQRAEQSMMGGLPFTEGVQTGEDFGVVVAIQAYAADQELLVNLTYDWAGEGSSTFTGHPKALTQESHSLSAHTLHTDHSKAGNVKDTSDISFILTIHSIFSPKCTPCSVCCKKGKNTKARYYSSSYNTQSHIHSLTPLTPSLTHHHITI